MRQEISILKSLSHPNIIQLHDAFEERKHFVVVMEYAQGDLFAVLEDDRTMPLDELQKLAAQLVSALQYLHTNRIIHRDMKPQNILLSADGSVKLCDFGFARSMSAATNMVTSVKGTPLYMAPEVVQQQPYDFRADLWSLGVILFELFTGEPPFYTESIYKLVDLILKEPVPWPRDMPTDLRSFLGGLLQKRSSDRLAWPNLAKHPFVAGRVTAQSRAASSWDSDRAFAGAHLVWFGDAADPPSPAARTVPPVPMRIASFSAGQWAGLQERVKTLGQPLTDPPLAASRPRQSAQLSDAGSSTNTSATQSPSRPTEAAHSAVSQSASSGPAEAAHSAVSQGASSGPAEAAHSAVSQGASSGPRDSLDSVDSAVQRLLRAQRTPEAADGVAPSAEARQALVGFISLLEEGDFDTASALLSQLPAPTETDPVADWPAIWKHAANIVQEPVNASTDFVQLQRSLQCLSAALQHSAPCVRSGVILQGIVAEVLDDMQLMMDEALVVAAASQTVNSGTLELGPTLGMIGVAAEVIGHCALHAWFAGSFELKKLGMQNGDVSPEAVQHVAQALQRCRAAMAEQSLRLSALYSASSLDKEAGGVRCVEQVHGAALALRILEPDAASHAVPHAALVKFDGEAWGAWLLSCSSGELLQLQSASVLTACQFLQNTSAALVGAALILDLLVQSPRLDQQATTAPELEPHSSPLLHASRRMLIAGQVGAVSSNTQLGFALPEKLCTAWLTNDPALLRQSLSPEALGEFVCALAYGTFKAARVEQSAAINACFEAMVELVEPHSVLTRHVLDLCSASVHRAPAALCGMRGQAFLYRILGRHEASVCAAVFKFVAKAVGEGIVDAEWVRRPLGDFSILEASLHCLLGDWNSSTAARKWGTCLIGNMLFKFPDSSSAKVVSGLVACVQNCSSERAVQENAFGALINCLQGANTEATAIMLLDAGILQLVLSRAGASGGRLPGLMMSLSCKLLSRAAMHPVWQTESNRVELAKLLFHLNSAMKESAMREILEGIAEQASD